MTQRLTAAEANATGHTCKRGHVGQWKSQAYRRRGQDRETRVCAACEPPYQPRPRRPKTARTPITAAEANTFEIGCRHGHFGYWYSASSASPACKICRRERNIKRYYGVPRAAYREMLAAAAGHCQCCGKAAALVLDHCHAHGHPRGLICNRCNLMAGVVESDDLPLVHAYLARAGSGNDDYLYHEDTYTPNCKPTWFDDVDFSLARLS